MAFPSDFVWGAATSSYQIEGAVDKHGRGPSVWDDFCRWPGAVRNGDTGDVACSHVARFAEDVAIMKRMNLRAYRFSIQWPRVIPEGVGAISEAGLGFYDRLVDEVLAAGIEPYCTLFHWDYPLALQRRGGWLNPSSPDWFDEYARVIVDRLSDRVSHWLTINEPHVFIILGHGTGEHAPGLKLPVSDQVLISHHVMMAHGRAARTIRERARTKPLIGWAPVGVISYPDSDSTADIEAARAATFRTPRSNLWSNTWYNDPVFLGRYPEDGLAHHAQHLPTSWERDLEIIHQPIDLHGTNIYRGTRVRAGADGVAEPVPLPTGCPRTSFGWEITPEVLYWGPRFLFERYHRPIVICENGMANRDWIDLDGRVRDPQRIDYTARHLLALERAVEEGVGIKGYFHWSLLDNFEWAEGYDQRFGLVHIDFATGTRTLKDSARWYAHVIETNGRALHERAPTDADAIPAPARRSSGTGPAGH